MDAVESPGIRITREDDTFKLNFPVDRFAKNYENSSPYGGFNYGGGTRRFGDIDE